MPILTGTTASGASATQLTATKTQVVALYITTTAQITLGTSGVTTNGAGINIAANNTTTPFGPISGPQGTFNLTELYSVGSATVTWLAVTR